MATAQAIHGASAGSRFQLVASGAASLSWSHNAATIATMPRRNGLYASHQEMRSPNTRT